MDTCASRRLLLPRLRRRHESSTLCTRAPQGAPFFSAERFCHGRRQRNDSATCRDDGWMLALGRFLLGSERKRTQRNPCGDRSLRTLSHHRGTLPWPSHGIGPTIPHAILGDTHQDWLRRSFQIAFKAPKRLPSKATFSFQTNCLLNSQ